MAEYSDDNERVDCGHYEYLDRTVPIEGGFLICAECSATLRAPVHMRPGWLSRQLKAAFTGALAIIAATARFYCPNWCPRLNSNRREREYNRRPQLPVH
jgi:hypothetical protein